MAVERVDVVRHRESIAKVILESLTDHGVFPTHKDISAQTGLSHVTVGKYVADISLKDSIQKARFLTPAVLLGMFKAAVGGNASSQKLWMQVVEGWQEGMNVNFSQTFDAKYADLDVDELKLLKSLSEKLKPDNE